MVKILTWNVNGLRSLITRFGSLQIILDLLDADIICFQEVKLTALDSSEICTARGYKAFFSLDRARRAYSGTATFVRNGIAIVEAQDSLTGTIGRERGTVLLANEQDLGIEKSELVQLDSEGRCVMTGNDALSPTVFSG